ncbi:MAG: amino acid permease, partial [Acetomicrobium flavidum]|nr:amino acid permease [Acetomicrobium flavidum]
MENSKKEVLSGSGALVRELGKLQGYATLIGVLIGSGIFVVIGTAGGMTGPSVPLSFLALYPVI